jgi:hypothetical protein
MFLGNLNFKIYAFCKKILQAYYSKACSIFYQFYNEISNRYTPYSGTITET